MILDPLLDLFRGKTITVPPMDGALRPNMALEEAEVLAESAAPDNLVAAGDRILFSSGAVLMAMPRPGAASPEPLERFDAPVSALACAPGGALAVGLDDGRIFIRDSAGAQRIITDCSCPVAMAFDDEGALYVCNGSAQYRPADWAADLLSKTASGSLWRIGKEPGGAQCLATGLAFPYGLIIDAAQRRFVVSEAWRHRLVSVALEGGSAKPVLTQLPGYPARLSPSESGAILSIFAPKNRLIEFVLEEDDYRADMMREIDRANWIAPALSASHSFLEPLQCGGVRTMGIHKPWSPSRSYGLVVELDRQWQPVASYHSRANGRRHGITSAVAVGDRLIAASKGSNAVLVLRRQRWEDWT